MNRRPDRVEQYEQFVAEYRRVRDSQGEEVLFVTMRRDTVTPHDTIKPRWFHIDMDALERFASREVPKDFYAKPFDRNNPDFVERFNSLSAHLGLNIESIARKSGQVREQFATGGRISW